MRMAQMAKTGKVCLKEKEYLSQKLILLQLLPILLLLPMMIWIPLSKQASLISRFQIRAKVHSILMDSFLMLQF